MDGLPGTYETTPRSTRRRPRSPLSRIGWRPAKFVGTVLALALSSGNALAAGVNWCAIPDLIPSAEADFERIAPLVEGATGCARSASDSAHDAEWKCPDDPAKPGDDSVLIKLIRDPGTGINLLVGGWSIQSLDAIRACRVKGAIDGSRFEAGNVAHRDQLTFDYGSRTLTLLNMGPESLGVAYSGRRFRDDGFARSFLKSLFGIEPISYPTTSVKLAGADPIATYVFDLVTAFEKRGSAITASKDLEDALPEWTLSPPTGLPGVASVNVTGFVRHVLSTRYAMSSTADYERYVALLDGEYGASRRTADGACSLRNWSSGKVTMIGRHCPQASTSELTFWNDVASDQLDEYVKKMDADKASKPKTTRPTVDRDNF